MDIEDWKNLPEEQRKQIEDDLAAFLVEEIRKEVEASKERNEAELAKMSAAFDELIKKM